jgi:hypothetical protein
VTFFEGLKMTEETYLEANTYGIGQLITQRKMFVVPEHQRDFAWTLSDVETFFGDIENAMQRGDPDYFVGLVVLLGPRDNKWIILDGQQRLITTTMIYSAIRGWLSSRGFEQDAAQIDSEYIAVRILGGDYLPRLVPNVTNRSLYSEVVVRKRPDEDIRHFITEASRYSSNRLLLEAALRCRQLVNEFVSDKGGDIEKRLFRLAYYLESRVRVVAMDVSSEANAYVIFESLNARGNVLAVLDLVKNYVFGKASPEKMHWVQDQWQAMAVTLEDRNVDDFLKTFWTSQFGRVQKQQLYNRVKDEFGTPDAAASLVQELQVKAEYYVAIDDPYHDIWQSYGATCQRYLRGLITLGSRQIRAPIMSSIHRLGREEMEALLWALIVLTVRHQVVGRRRTGLLEIYCANLASQIFTGKLKSKQDILKSVHDFMPKDDDFRLDFLRFSEAKKPRAIYFLVGLENTRRRRDGALEQIELMDTAEFGIEDLLSHDEAVSAMVHPEIEAIEEYLARIGNKALVEKRSWHSQEDRFMQFGVSSLILTREITPPIDRSHIDRRQEYLAELAVGTWTFAGQL